MLTIKEILKGSVSEKTRLIPGDQIFEVNGKSIKDEIDFRFHSSDERLKIKFIRNNNVDSINLKNMHNKSLGIVFNEMEMFECGTDCIFCFVTQNPKGLRKSLYFKDGDYRMSFLYGNYITLTNIGHNALKRIVEQRLSPLYVSVHSTVPEIRQYYMNLRKDDKILEKLKYLVNNRIKIHAQIVLSPEINDQDSLLKTIYDLYHLSSGIESLAIVPVGLTKHRTKLKKINKIDHKYANNLINLIKPIQNKIRVEHGMTWVYLSDEFYLQAKKEIPSADYYDDYPQIENGVGMTRLFYDSFINEYKKLPKSLSKKKEITFATGTLSYKYLMDNILPRMNQIKNLKINLIPIKNRLFGSSVTVSGLLSMHCLCSGLKNESIGDLLVLPENILNYDGLFLDDGTPDMLSRILGKKVYIFKNSWKELIKYVENL